VAGAVRGHRCCDVRLMDRARRERGASCLGSRAPAAVRGVAALRKREERKGKKASRGIALITTALRVDIKMKDSFLVPAGLLIECYGFRVAFVGLDIDHVCAALASDPF
jgi:hypothetical protein